jgi:FtsZ-binding cell division protein ZapB
MVYFGHAMPDSLASLIAVARDNISDLQRESERQRESIHTLQSAIHGVRLLTKEVDELQESMPNLARRAAKEAVEEDRRVRHRDWYANLRTYAALVSSGAAFGALIVALVLR